MRIFFLFFITYFAFTSFVSEEEKIPWSKDNKLTWSDFKGTAPSWNEYIATTTSGVSYKYSYSKDGDKVINKVVVSCNFYPNKSWYNKKDTSAYVLKHEQTHFDISELYARKFRKKIKKVTMLSKDISKDLRTIFYKNEDERTAIQDKFDEETDHSRNKEKELKWERFVAKQLIAYESWK